MEIYFYVGGYWHPFGSLDYLTAFKEFCKNFLADVTVIPSLTIREGCLNVFIESLSVEEVNYLRGCKERNKNTRYLVILTEFIQELLGRGIAFNVFDEKSKAYEEEMIRRRNENKGSLRRKIRVAKTIIKTRHLWRERQFDVGTGRIELSRRAAALEMAEELIDIVVVSHPDILKESGSFWSGGVYYDFPYVIDENWIDSHCLDWSICFSGSLTSYRERVVNRLNKGRDGGLIKRFAKELSNEDADLFRRTSPMVEIWKGNYEESIGGEENRSLFELYIPQSEGWRYMSPMRIYHALIRGRITVMLDEMKDKTMKELVRD